MTKGDFDDLLFEYTKLTADIVILFEDIDVTSLSDKNKFYFKELKKVYVEKENTLANMVKVALLILTTYLDDDQLEEFYGFASYAGIL